MLGRFRFDVIHRRLGGLDGVNADDFVGVQPRHGSVEDTREPEFRERLVRAAHRVEVRIRPHNDPHVGRRGGIGVGVGLLVEAVDPADVIRELGDRINSVHLKDTSDAEEEDLPGAGRLDLPYLLNLLDEHADVSAPLVIEYELPDKRATAALQAAEANIRNALSASGGE